MPLPILALPFLGKALTVAVSGKIVLIGLNMLTAQTSKGSRIKLLEHVAHVMSPDAEDGIEINPSDRRSLDEDLTLLRNSAHIGWTDPVETKALARILGFLTKSHLKATQGGASALASSHANAFGDWVWKTGEEVLEFLAPKIRVP
jgi:hypothetical protein